MNNALLSIKQAKEIIKSNVTSLSIEVVNLENSISRITSEDIIATIDQQPFNNSAMDGYAIKSSYLKNINNDHEIKLKIADTVIAAGSKVLNIDDESNGTPLTVKVMTGAPMPEGFDITIPVEEAIIQDTFLIVKNDYKPLENVRTKGEDFIKGSVLVKKNHLMTSYETIVLKTSGINEIKVYRKPTVGILTTGTEFNEENKVLDDGKIYNSNLTFLQTFLRQHNFEITNLGNVSDDRNSLQNVIEKYAGQFDLIISTGAVSKGDFDIVPQVLSNYGKILYHFLNIRPGKPNLLVKLNKGGLWFGLPGNPVSTMVAVRVLVYYYYLCATNRNESSLLARLNQDFHKRHNLTLFYPGILKNDKGVLVVDPLKKFGSHVTTSFVNSNVLIKFKQDYNFFSKDSLVPVYLLKNLYP